MIQFLVYVGLVLIPLVLCQGLSPREVKEMVALAFACGIALTALYEGRLKKVNNYWILFLLFFMLCSTFFVPKVGLAIGSVHKGEMFVSDNTELDNLWNYKPILYAFIYFFMFIGIIGSKVNINTVMKCIAWSSVICASYCILQKFGFEQFLKVKPYSLIGSVDNASIVGTMGQPTLCAAYLALCMPALIFSKKWLFMPVVALAVFFCGSDIAFGAAIVGLVMLLAGKNKIVVKIVFTLLVAAFFVFIQIYHFQDSGRFSVWSQILTDLREQRHSITGFGPGAFHYLYSATHKSTWFQAHNEYLEFLYNYGSLGLMLFLVTIASIYKYILRFLEVRAVRYLGAMFLIACLCAGGTFPWQLGVTAFYTVVIVGMIYNIGENHVA